MSVNQLKIVISILKEVSEGNIPKAEDYGMENRKYYDILDAMQDDGLIKNVRFNRGANKEILIVFDEHMKITIRGMEYLNNNTELVKTYKGLKEVREWLQI